MATPFAVLAPQRRRGRTSILFSALTISTKAPDWSIWMAFTGTTSVGSALSASTTAVTS